MPIEIALHRWEADTRPCDFCLNLKTPRGNVFADFDELPDKGITLRRISFDGYGCCGTEGRCSKMSSADATTLINAISEKDVNKESIFGVLCRYLAENSSIIWSDALVEHQLDCPGNLVR